jgi:hypothetical protein
MDLKYDSNDQNSKLWRPSPILNLETNKCYHYKTLVSFTVTDRSPFIFQQDSDSHEVYAKDSLGNVFIVECDSSSTVIVESDWIKIGQGTGEKLYSSGKFVPYDKSTCNPGQDTRGSEGTLNVITVYKVANFIDKKSYTTTECSYECERNSDCGSKEIVGERYCSGNNIVQDYIVPTCSNYNCQINTRTETLLNCDDECENGVCISAGIIDEEELEELEEIVEEISDTIEEETDTSSLDSDTSDEEEPINYLYFIIPIVLLTLLIFIIYKLTKIKKR